MTVPTLPADPATHPELVFGLVGPVGVDLHVVAHVLKEALLQIGYDSETVRLSKLMKELPGKP